MTLEEVRAAFQPSMIGAISDSARPDGCRVRALLDECAEVLGSRPLSYGIGHGRLFVRADAPVGNLLQVEVFFEGQFVEVSWHENWYDDAGLWTRRESLRCPAERSATTFVRFLRRLGCGSRGGEAAEPPDGL